MPKKLALSQGHVKFCSSLDQRGRGEKNPKACLNLFFFPTQLVCKLLKNIKIARVIHASNEREEESGGGKKKKSLFPGRHFGSCLHLQSVCFSCCKAIWLSEELTALNSQPLLAATSYPPPNIKGCVFKNSDPAHRGQKRLLFRIYRALRSSLWQLKKHSEWSLIWRLKVICQEGLSKLREEHCRWMQFVQRSRNIQGVKERETLWCRISLQPTGSKDTAKNSMNLRSLSYLPFDGGGGCWECWFLEKKHSKQSMFKKTHT